MYKVGIGLPMQTNAEKKRIKKIFMKTSSMVKKNEKKIIHADKYKLVITVDDLYVASSSNISTVVLLLSTK